MKYDDLKKRAGVATINEKSFIFGIDPDQKSDINKLVLMEINYYIYYERCSKSNMNPTVLQHRLKNFYTKHISTRPFQQESMTIFKQTNKTTITYYIKRQTKKINNFIKKNSK